MPNPFTEALERGKIETVARLLREGADPNQRISNGQTPLMIAAAAGHKALVRLLLEHGARPELRDANGTPAAEFAARNGHDSIVRLFDTTAPNRFSEEAAALFRDIWGSEVFDRVRLRASTPPSATPPKNDAAETFVHKLEDKTPKEDILEETLIGQDRAKAALKQAISIARVNQERAHRKLPPIQVTLHAVFSGSPGTGKTTFARYYAQEIRKLGILKKGHLVEVSRPDLVAGYMGQTAAKTTAIIENAKGGILFIDEAYALKHGHEDTYGQECIDTLIKAIEDLRDQLIVILAGYTNEMREFLHLNPGLKSRIPNVIEFEDFTDEELGKIFDQMLAKAA